jgi:hypothetical protein
MILYSFPIWSTYEYDSDSYPPPHFLLALTRRQELLPLGKFTYESVLAGIFKEVLGINIHYCIPK